MLQKIKETIVNIVNTAGYEIYDNGFYKEEFPHLMIRTSNQAESYTKDLNIQVIDLIIDIFSDYSGEKEIQDIKDRITPIILNNCNTMPEVMFSSLKTFKILDDKKTGPVRKHGILVYRFIVTFPKEVENNGTN